MASSGSFYQLPDELLVKIFTYLDILDLVRNVQHVDSRWKAIVQDISFWRDYVFTVDEQMADKEIIELLENMPALQAVVAARPVSGKVILTLCQSNKCITSLELCYSFEFTVSDLETIVTNLPQIQHLAFPLLWRKSENTMKYSTLIQQLHELLSLRLLGVSFDVQNCFFLKRIATECPLLHEIDFDGHLFLIEDINLFLKEKKDIITKFAAHSRNSIEMIHHLESCKQLQSLSLSYRNETLPNIPLFDLPNLKHLAFTHFVDHFPIIARNLQESIMSNIVKLDVTSCSFETGQLENILDKCVNLKILILDYCGIPNDDAFQYISNCTNLEYLDVNNTMIPDCAVGMFAEKCTKLKYLDISNCPEITDYSLQCLIQCRKLQTLLLSHTHITGKYFHLIPLYLMKLCDLYVEYCECNLQDVQHLKEQMPHLHIHASVKDSVYLTLL